jgi:FlaA1/EpsC-like NDP-sugar epimerase
MLTVLLVGGLRSAGRLSREQVIPFLQMKFLKDHRFRGAVIVGATPGGIYVAGQIAANPQLRLRIVGLLDADESLHGRRLSGLLVLGHPDDVCEHARAAGASDVFVLAGELHGKELRQMIDRCRTAGLNLKIVPAMDEWMVGQSFVGPNGLRYRDVDINDLLRRDPVSLDDAAVAKFVRGKTVMVTGAGGSIGAEICRQLLPYGPRAVLLVERAENNLFQIDRELKAKRAAAEIVPCLADVVDGERMRTIFEMHRPDVVFHAAAHKHVPMMEENPGEAIKNNTFGTKAVADLAHEFGLEGFVLVSTDKAVNPSSVMGVSKQLAERYVHALSQVSSTRFIAVRFGNVLGSVGSVVPIFQQQIHEGGPITVTHPEMRRFFMTIPEASQLVMQAGAMGRGGEIYVLDMGEPVRIVDLAKDLIRLSGLSPDDIDIVVTGIRPGEKLFEELYFDDEQTLPTPHPKVRVAYHRPYTVDEVLTLFDELRPTVDHENPAAVIRRLRRLIPEFSAEMIAAGDDSDGSIAVSVGSAGDLERPPHLR